VAQLALVVQPSFLETRLVSSFSLHTLHMTSTVFLGWPDFLLVQLSKLSWPGLC
jgi:hypothetical protein